MPQLAAVRASVGDQVLSTDGSTVNVEHICQRVKKVGLFFAAHWSRDSRYFTPKLIKYYNKLKALNKCDFEIVFISSDKEEKLFQEYFASMPWFAIDFKSFYARQAAAQKYIVERLPTLVFIDCKTGEIVNDSGVSQVEQDLLSNPLLQT